MSVATETNEQLIASGSVDNKPSSGVYDKPEDLQALADVLRRKLKIRNGVFQENRVEYFKGNRLIEFLMTDLPKEAPKLPQVDTKEKALEVSKELLRVKTEGAPKYFMRVSKVKKGLLDFHQKQEFEENGYFLWIYEGPQAISNLMTFFIIAGFLAITCFPIWPHFLKVWLWYLSVTMLTFMLGFLLVRFLLFLFFWVLGYEFWIFPNLFDESLSFVDSFKPVYSFDRSPKGQGIYRGAVVLAFLVFLYWAYTQPTEFDSLVAAQKQFMHDLYEGNLLSDVAQSDKENIDKVRAFPSYEELLKESELDVAGGDSMTEEERADNVIDHLLKDEEADEEEEEEEAAAAHGDSEGDASEQ